MTPRRRAVSLWPRDVVADLDEIRELALAIRREYPGAFRTSASAGGAAGDGGGRGRGVWSDPTANVALDDRKAAARRAVENAARSVEYVVVELRGVARSLNVPAMIEPPHDGTGSATAAELVAAYDARDRRRERGDE